MKKTLNSLMFGALLGAFLTTGLDIQAQTTPAKDAAPTTKAKDAADTTKAKRDWYPFGATVSSVDTKAKTISLKKKDGERVLLTDTKTTLEQNGKPAALADVKPGNYLHGKLHKNAANAEVLLDAKIELAPPIKALATNQAAAAADASTNAPAKKKKKTTTP